MCLHRSIFRLLLWLLLIKLSVDRKQPDSTDLLVWWNKRHLYHTCWCCVDWLTTQFTCRSRWIRSCVRSSFLRSPGLKGGAGRGHPGTHTHSNLWVSSKHTKDCYWVWSEPFARPHRPNKRHESVGKQEEERERWADRKSREEWGESGDHSDASGSVDMTTCTNSGAVMIRRVWTEFVHDDDDEGSLFVNLCCMLVLSVQTQQTCEVHRVTGDRDVRTCTHTTAFCVFMWGDAHTHTERQEECVFVFPWEIGLYGAHQHSGRKRNHSRWRKC